MKRLFDLSIAVPALALLAVPMLIVALALWRAQGWPVFFTQTRPGLHGKPFELIKFRTMRDAFDAHGQPLPDQERTTAIGRFLRSTSLDELPELWNVIKGEMSLVGPRPLLMDYLPYYTDEQMRRHDELPGITGWAQVNGRNALTWEEKFRHDIWYVDNRTVLLDVKVLALTALKVFRREDIDIPDLDTHRRFDQTQPRLRP